MRENECLSGDHGFTLVEAIIAVAVFSIGVLSVYLVQTTAVRGNATASGITVASNKAAEKFEQFVGMDYDDATIASGNYSDPSDGRFQVFWTVTDDDPMPNIKHIQVDVDMKERGVLKTLSFEHYKALY